MIKFIYIYFFFFGNLVDLLCRPHIEMYLSISVDKVF